MPLPRIAWSEQLGNATLSTRGGLAAFYAMLPFRLPLCCRRYSREWLQSLNGIFQQNRKFMSCLCQRLSPSCMQSPGSVLAEQSLECAAQAQAQASNPDNGYIQGWEDYFAQAMLQRVASGAEWEVPTIDLHFQIVPAAKKLVWRFLSSLLDHKMGLPTRVDIITGHGKHSKDGQPKIRLSVEALLRGWGLDYSFENNNKGKFVVYLS